MVLCRPFNKMLIPTYLIVKWIMPPFLLQWKHKCTLQSHFEIGSMYSVCHLHDCDGQIWPCNHLHLCFHCIKNDFHFNDFTCVRRAVSVGCNHTSTKCMSAGHHAYSIIHPMHKLYDQNMEA